MCGAPDQATIDRTGIPTGETVIQGLVYQGASPLSGGYVRLLDGGDDFTAEVITSATGQFRFFARPGSWTVRVIPGQGHEGGSAPAQVAAGEITEVRISV
jgi:Protein of unknown function (DUF1416)